MSAAVTAPNGLICTAIDDLGLTAIATGKPQHISFGRIAANRAGCGPVEVPAHREFCEIVVRVIGINAPHRFPWAVYDCLGMSHGIPRVDTADEFSGVEGRKKVRRMTATLKNGLFLEIKFTPTGDFGTRPFYKNYFGTYDLVIWKG